MKFGIRPLKHNRKTNHWAFLAGLGLGSAIGMLIAPKSGIDLRDDIQDFARDSYQQGRERLQPLIDQAREKVEPTLNQARHRVDPFMDAVAQRVDSVLAQAASVSDRVVHRVAEAKEHISNGDLLSILNDWPHERLIEINGIGPVLAAKIIQHRPYESEEALIAGKFLPPSAIESLRKAA